MSRTPESTVAAPARRRIDPLLAAIVGGAVLLIVAGLLALPLIAGREPALAPASSPEGVVQRFYQAAYANDFATAHGYLAAETQARISANELQQQLGQQLRQTQMRVAETSIVGDSATVQATITHSYPGGLFGSDEWTEQTSLVLNRDADSWKIVSGPFALPAKT